MAKYLVIVESPAKVKTIKKFLGANYDVEASNGHVRDFPKSQFGIDVEHDFEPKYITIRGKGELLAKLRKAAKKADKIYLATDPDREGEAISWHLMQALKEDPKKMHRITFNEITKTAVKSSIKQARDLDMDLVDAQQARRMLDRMVGYTISPLLWAKVKRGLSAGRVQSVALRIICDREDEINAFIPEEYWTIDTVLKVEGEKKPLVAKFYGTEKQKMTIRSKEELDNILGQIENEEYNVAGKIIPLKSFNKTRSNAFVFEDVKKISRNILEMTSSDNMITLENIYGTSAATQSLKENIQKIANTNSTVLITGESGTGKELVARSLHSHGNRRNKPFVVINCSAIPDTLLESELFGYVKGAFTGASQNGRMGKFELANTGVIFLDEIGDMPLYLQAKILRVIQEKKIERIGSNKSIDLDIKIIAATNVDLEKKIMEQKFRGDLYYRLNVIPIKLLPLRERKEDIIPIINSLIDKYNRLSDKYVHSIDEDVKKALINYEWPGNVRELENVMELMISMSGSNGVISSDLLPDNILHHFDTAPSSVEELILNDKSELEDFEKIEKVYIEKSLEKYGDDTESKKYIADKMSIGLTTLYRKMKKYNIK